MLNSAIGLSHLRPYYNDDTRELFGVFLNSTSAAEANLALQVLEKTVPYRSLVTACNLREILRALPCSPFMMHVDEDLLCRTARLERDMAVLRKTLGGGIELVVTTAGNLVLDVIVKHGDEKYFWTPIPIVDDYVNPDVVELVVTSDDLLDEIIELVKCMGVVFNPKFYLSLDDFHLENAAEVFEGIGELFHAPAPKADPAFREESPSMAIRTPWSDVDD